MKSTSRFTQFVILGLALLASGCASVSQAPQAPQSRALRQSSDAEMVKVRVVVAPEISKKIPTKSRIVITNFDGLCALEVQDALMRRLVDNAEYDVLTRDYLRQILVESEESWTGKFDSRTATRLGELLGASLFVVGRIAYCGPSKEPLEGDNREGYSILAVLQILDLRTGKVLVSSAGEGSYFPNSARLLVAENKSTPADGNPQNDPDDYVEAPASQVTEISEPITIVDESTPGWFEKRLGDLKKVAGKVQGKVQGKVSQFDPKVSPDDKVGNQPRPVNFVAFKAAEDLANRFADKFFARPTWEDVKMWTSPAWSYGESIQFVKLGHCQEGVGYLQNLATQELSSMSDLDVARYLHNLGVTFLCNNEPEEAMKKLRSAYRLAYDPATLEMLELAARIVEWSLTVEIDKEPEVDMLIERKVALQES